MYRNGIWITSADFKPDFDLVQDPTNALNIMVEIFRMHVC